MVIRHFQTIGVVGAGTMGAQIAPHCAAHGYRVRLFSRSTETLQRAAQGHALELEQRLARRDITADEQEGLLSRIQSTTDMQEAVAKADLVIENVPEDFEIKRAVFGQLDRLSPRHALLAKTVPPSASRPSKPMCLKGRNGRQYGGRMVLRIG